MQLWYHMYGEGMGTLNVYQQSEDGKRALIFSQIGDQGWLWRFAQASLLPRVQSYRVSHKYPPDSLIILNHSSQNMDLISLSLKLSLTSKSH